MPRAVGWLRVSVAVATSALLSSACGGEPRPPGGAVVWLRADEAVVTADGSPATDGAEVTGWGDRSGSGNDAAVVPFPPGLTPADGRPDRRPRFAAASSGLNGRPALRFDGRDDLMGIADAVGLNLGGPFTERTFVFALQTGANVIRRQMIFETGGDLRGFNVFLNDGELSFGAFDAWNDDHGKSTPFGPLTVSVGVRPRTAYVVSFVFDQPHGRMTGFLNGKPFGSVTGVGVVFQHHEDVGIGGIDEDTYYPDGVRQGVPTGDFFEGELAEILIYNQALATGPRKRTEAYLMGKYGVKPR